MRSEGEYPLLSFDCELYISLTHPKVNLRKKVLEYVEKWNASLSDEARRYGLESIVGKIDGYRVKVDIMPWCYEIEMLSPEYGDESEGINIKIYPNVPFHSFVKEFPEFCRKVLGIDYKELKINSWCKRNTIKAMREIADFLDQLEEG